MDERDDERDGWPRCPQCNAPRITRCPICETTGSDFAEADSDFVWGLGLDEVAEPDSGSCRSGACGASASCAGQSGSEADPPEPKETDDGGQSRPVLMCPTCDEPFLPVYPLRCAWCGYDFGEGYEVDAVDQPPEEITSRIILILIAMALLSALVAYHFASLT